jgi:phage tail-like protein
MAKAFDPLLTYRFRVKWNGSYVAGVTRVSGLTDSGAEASRAQPPPALEIPEQSDFQPVHLERGIITDSAFEDWANLVWSFPDAGLLGDEPEMSDFRKELQIELYDEAGQPVLGWTIHKCWPSEYTALPELDSDSNAVALASMTIHNEGWERVPVSPPQ